MARSEAARRVVPQNHPKQDQSPGLVKNCVFIKRFPFSARGGAPRRALRDGLSRARKKHREGECHQGPGEKGKLIKLIKFSRKEMARNASRGRAESSVGVRLNEAEFPLTRE